MKVTPIPFDLDLMQNAPDYVRSPGLHMSEIYNQMYKEIDPDRYDRPDDPESKAGFIGAGLALEEALERSLAYRLTAGAADGRPGEFVEPEYGIIFSPDLFLFTIEEPPRLRVAEIKMTWQTCREWPSEPTNGMPAKADKYMTQIMNYCHCLETNLGRLYALFVNGDYNRKRGLIPKPLAWDFEFTAREMHESWSGSINFAKMRGMIR